MTVDTARLSPPNCRRQKERSRNAAAVDTDDWVELLPIAESRFVGYDTLESDVRISRYRRVTAKNKTYFPAGFRPDAFLRQFGRADRRPRDTSRATEAEAYHGDRYA